MDDINDQHPPYRQTPSLRLAGEQLPNISQTRNPLSVSNNERAIAAKLGATRLFGCYRRDEAADPEIYFSGAVAILARYCESIIMAVSDPADGLPATCKWLPTLQEIREACDNLQGGIDRENQREAGIRRQLAERAEIDRQEADRDRRPTVKELKAKYGENWGIGSTEAEQAPKSNFKRFTHDELRAMYPVT